MFQLTYEKSHSQAVQYRAKNTPVLHLIQFLYYLHCDLNLYTIHNTHIEILKQIIQKLDV
jgi:hypothetical protein